MSRAPYSPAGLLPVTAILLASGGGGFLLHRFMGRVHPTLYADVGAAAKQQPPAAGSGPSAATAGPQSPADRKIPDTLPDITLPGPDGVPHSLWQWRGRPLVVNFWATWCEPCRREIPLLKSLRRERAQDHLQIVGIAIDSRDAVRKYAAMQAIDYPVLIGEEGGFAAVSAFGMDAVLPFSVFADRAGNIVALMVGELHRDEAVFILDRLAALDQGQLGLADARREISAGIARLKRARAGLLRTAQAGTG